MDDMLTKTLAENIRMAMESIRYKQKEMADLLGVSQAAYSRWESGERVVDIDLMPKIAEVTNKPLSWFFEIHNPAQVSETKDTNSTILKSNEPLSKTGDNKASGDTNTERGMVQKLNMEKVESLLENLVAKQDQLIQQQAIIAEEQKKDRQEQKELIAAVFLTTC